ncbi:MAG TPA: hypothetical protein DCQ83_02160 [Fibrobacteres bacterium]|jgi:F-type H+-transporting ATPase subunit delta|nr:hypothetical protein [Fibrobacterota bacterium]
MAKRHYKAAGVYAKTLLELASTKGGVDALKQEMESLRDVFAKVPELGRALQMPVLSAEKKAALAKSLADNASDMLKRLIKLLEVKGRLVLLESIAEEFLRLEEERRQISRAKVISAVPLSDAQLKSLAEGLSAQRSGRTYVLHNEVDPTLIAGFRVEEGDRVVDASLRHKLNAIRHKLAA